MSIYERAYYVDDWDREREMHVTGRKVGKPLGSDNPHYPNKAERKLLTQMMQKSGQTEEQVRESKSNRRKLAAASNSMSKSQSGHSRREYEMKIDRRNRAARLGVQVWQLN